MANVKVIMVDASNCVSNITVPIIGIAVGTKEKILTPTQTHKMSGRIRC